MKGFNGITTIAPQIDPTAGGHVPRNSNAALIRAACDRFLREREPGFAAKADKQSETSQRTKATHKRNTR